MHVDPIQADGPKLLQRKAPREAAEMYASMYREALSERDQFLGSLYMDELLASLIMARSTQNTRGLPSSKLRAEAREILGRVSREEAELLDEDLEVGLWKRYPNEFHKQENLELQG